MNLYEAILKRKSIRKYKKEVLTEQTLRQIGNFIRKTTALYDTIRVEFRILDHGKGEGELRGLWKVEAPYYLVFFSEEKEGYERNAGYILEQVVLYLTTKALGSCYLGAVKVRDLEIPGMKQVMVVAFGRPESVLYRDSATAKRLPLKELCIYKEEPDEAMKTILKAARLAPPSMNSQPWRFIVMKDRVMVFMCKEFSLRSAVPSLRQFNVGIMMCHLALAAEELWLEADFQEDENLKKKNYKNGQYVATVVFA